MKRRELIIYLFTLKNILYKDATPIDHIIDNITNKLISFKVKLDENMKMYQDKFNFMYKSYKRFMNEDFISYDIYRRKIESIINSTKNLIQKGNDIDLFDTTISNTIIQTSPNDYNQSIFNNENENIVMENDDSIICNNLFKENSTKLRLDEPNNNNK